MLALVLALAACGKSGGQGGSSSAAPADPVLAAYRTGLAPLEKLETEALAAVAAHTGDAYTSDEDLLKALKDIAIPRYKDFVTGLEHLAPPPGMRADLHAKLLVLVHSELEALEKLAAALEHGDGNAVLAVNREQRRLADEIDALMTQAGAPPAAVPQTTSSSAPNDASK
jgi:hypothetical protein